MVFSFGCRHPGVTGIGRRERAYHARQRRLLRCAITCINRCSPGFIPLAGAFVIGSLRE